MLSGWEPTRDRNITNYIMPNTYNFKFDPIGCTWRVRDRIDLIIMQHSWAGSFDVRMDSRKTWKKYEER